MNNSTSNPKKGRVLVIRLSSELQRRRENPTLAEIAANTLQGLKSGKVTPRTVKTDFEKRAEETNAILKRVGVRK